MKYVGRKAPDKHRTVMREARETARKGQFGIPAPEWFTIGKRRTALGPSPLIGRASFRGLALSEFADSVPPFELVSGPQTDMGILVTQTSCFVAVALSLQMEATIR